MWIVRAIATVAVGLAATGCGGGGDGGNGGELPTGPDPENPPVSTNAVTVNSASFSPSSITVDPGATVTWTWAANNVDHNVTFAGGGPNSPTQSSGSFSRTFSSAGTFNYSCTIHGASMSGSVTVSSASNGTGGDPTPDPDDPYGG